nr:PREDICTED: GATS-like protein 3 [Apteryx mantelli mantelli]
MLDEEGFKELPPSEFMQVADSTWLVLSVVSNGRASSGCQATGVTKIAKSVIAPLAEHNVSVLMLSTYQTDFILVREKDLPMVIHTLAGEFDIYKEENGESVPVNCDDVSNGFLKPKPAASPTVHPVQSPQNRFCILTVAPDTLPAIATMLIDVLFYSHSPPKEAGPGSQDLDTITFFAFSLIEGYISIVMDAETQKRFPSDLLLTSSTGELWRMVRIGGQPLGFDECGIVAQIAEPLANVDISAYYISTFNFDHALVPEDGIAEVIEEQVPASPHRPEAEPRDALQLGELVREVFLRLREAAKGWRGRSHETVVTRAAEIKKLQSANAVTGSIFNRVGARQRPAVVKSRCFPLPPSPAVVAHFPSW